MKKFKSFFLAALFLFITVSQQSCIGSFQLTNRMYQWNKNEIGGKWGSELVFAGLVIIPIYEVVLLADGIVLNSIEFWTGNNPLAMNKDAKEVQIVQQGNETYKVTVEQNSVKVDKIGGEHSGETGEFTWNEEAQSWTFVSEGKHFELKP